MSNRISLYTGITRDSSFSEDIHIEERGNNTGASPYSLDLRNEQVGLKTRSFQKTRLERKMASATMHMIQVDKGR